MATGTVSLVFSAFGILLAGIAITKYKPRARPMAAWNVAINFVTVTGVLSLTQLGCLENEQSIVIDMPILRSNFSLNRGRSMRMFVILKLQSKFIVSHYV